MKKLMFFGVLILVGCAFAAGHLLLTTTSAQVRNGEKNAQSGDVKRERDRNLAKTIKKLTNRSFEGLKKEVSADGSISVDLDERFQNVMLAKVDEDGEPSAACVTDLDEANQFFGRNLETGEFISSYRYQKDYAGNIAARHGMSEDELAFYKKMIDDAVKSKAASPNAASIVIVNNDGAGEGFNDTTAKTAEGGNTGTTLGQQRLNLFNYAANIWGAFLDTTVQINVRSQFNSLTPCSTSGGVLGSAGTLNIHANFTNAEYTNTWYHAALANKISGSDRNTSNPEINATFNSDVDNGCLGTGRRFYYGLDNSTPSNTTNLLIVLLHEMGHGLGFSSFVNGSTGALNSGVPDIYTRFMYDKTVSKYWYQMTDAERQTSALNTNNVYWDGANVKAASNFLTAGRDSDGRVQLYTPSTFSSGSSISHFSTATTQNLLMEPSINTGLPLTLDLTRQLMRDIGWFVDKNGDLTADSITNVVPSSNPLAKNTQATVNWTNTGGFSGNVTIELSTDGGATYPTLIASNVANTGSYTFTVPDITSLSAKIRVRENDFMSPVGESDAFKIQLTVTSATATVSGRVVNNKGFGITGATVLITDPQGDGKTARTNLAGYFQLTGIEVGKSYVVSASAKGYAFEPRLINVNAGLTELSITGSSQYRW